MDEALFQIGTTVVVLLPLVLTSAVLHVYASRHGRGYAWLMRGTGYDVRFSDERLTNARRAVQLWGLTLATMVLVVALNLSHSGESLVVAVVLFSLVFLMASASMLFVEAAVAFGAEVEEERAESHA